MENISAENDVILQYGNRVFKTPEGKISLNDLLYGEEKNSDDFTDYIYNTSVKIASNSKDFTGKGIVIYRQNKDKALATGCIMKYFQPKSTYWKLNNKSRCEDIARAYDIRINSRDCVQCFKECISNNRRLKYPARLQKLADEIIDSCD